MERAADAAPGSGPDGEELVEVAWDVTTRSEDRVADGIVARAVHAALRHGGRPGAGLAVTFVDDATLTRMHAEYLDDPTPTDVITFPLGDDGVGPIGELYVSTERARALAAERSVPYERELVLYVVHGALHLCGLDDHEPHERAEMRHAESAVLQELGYPPDERPHDARVE